MEAGETWLVVVDNRLAATITVSWEDPIWDLEESASNQRLRAYYEDAGFLHRGDLEVHGAPGLRDQAGPRTLVSRYQRACPPSRSRQVG